MGNLLGDFRHGVEIRRLPPAVRNGLRNHLAVDAFTDHHPAIRQARARFSPRRRRFAGVALDVLFDHLLIRHWTDFATEPLDAWLEELHADLSAARPWMPQAMAETTARIVTGDWFRSYADLDNVGQALDRVADRIRFANRFDGMIEEIRLHESALEAAFLAFFPDLVRHVEQLGIEGGSPCRP